jgi:predicted nucleic acid-binding protein
MTAQRIETYSFTANDRLLLDTNIWLFLYCPHCVPNTYSAYSAAFKNILSAKSKIYVSSTILGEFIYRYCRLAHNLLVAKDAAPKRFKYFRKSPPFRKVAKAVADAARRVLQAATPVDEGFASLDIEGILTDFESGRHDFNDLLIAEVCGREKLILVTHDEDFSVRDLPILTANALLINMRFPAGS